MLSYGEMLFLCKEVSKELLGSRFLTIRQAGEKKWVIRCAQKGVERRLFICAKPPFSRFHLSTMKVSEEPSTFTREVEARLIGSVFTEVKLLGCDRILDCVWDKEGHIWHFVVELCARHPKVLLLDSDNKIWASHEAASKSHYHLPIRKFEHAAQEVVSFSQDVEKRYTEQERQQDFLSRLQKLRRYLMAELKKAQRRLKLHQEDLASGKLWEKERHLADLLKSHFSLWKRGMTEVVVQDWENNGEKVWISLNPLLEKDEQLKSRFHYSRKLKKRQELAEKWIGEFEEKVSSLQALIEQLDHIKAESELEELEKKVVIPLKVICSAKRKQEKSHPFREFTTLAGLKIFVGKKDVDNDRLTFRFANGKDIWLHAANAAGSHVVLRVVKGKPVDQESLQDAMQLALYFSKDKDKEEEDVIVAECQYVSKPKRAKPGQVTVSRHRTVRVRLSTERLERLLQKLIP